VRVITKRALLEFWERFPDAEAALRSWHDDAKNASWQQPADIKTVYRSASIVADNRVVFNICGNKYRLVVKIHYNTGFIYIRFIGTHAEYDRINATAV